MSTQDKQVSHHNLTFQNEEASKKFESVDSADFNSNTSIINSPRSLEACFRLGVDPPELYMISMDKFKELNPDVRKLSQKMQKYRYDEYDKFRNETITMVKEERQKITDDEAN